MFLSIVPFIATAITFCLTPLVQKLGLQWGWIDSPGKRKVHQQPIVRVGGIGIFTGTMLVILLTLLISNFYDFSNTLVLQVIGILIGGAGFFLIGLIDDIFHVSPFTRLLLQGLVTYLIWLAGVRVEVLPVPFIGVVTTGDLSFPITFLWLAGVANAINWIDGLDGLAGGTSAIAALTFGLVCWHNPPLALIALTLAGSLGGFLYYNVNPARIFMGDGGSYFIGFILAAIGAVGWMQSGTFAEVSLPFGILAVPIADMVRVIGSRLWTRKSPFFPDQQHLHHKLLQANFSVKTAVKFVWCLTAWCSSWAMLSVAIPYSAIALFLTSFLLISTSLSRSRTTLPVSVQLR